MSTPTILTVNCGSSSIRLDAFSGDPPGRLLSERAPGDRLADRIGAFAGRLEASVAAVAHRVVHGGEKLVATTRIDAPVERELEQLVRLAPLHNAPALEGIRTARALLPGAVQLAVFDTAFFARLPEAARTYALPRDLARRHGLRRYGFHGLAHEAMWRWWAAARPEHAGDGRVVSLQLGAGCSMAAIRAGVPLDTTMGFTPLEGLVMATRSGDLDPGLVTQLQRVAGLSPDDVDGLLYRESGLQGLAGESSMSEVLARTDADARLAIEVYCHRARRHLGACLAILGGADAILFGGGVGENAGSIRARILQGMEWAGVRLDEAANARPGTDGRIGGSDSRVDVRVVAVDEAALLAEEALRAIR